MKRKLIESLEARKDAMIAALWSNSNYDDDKGTRKGAIEEIEQNFEEAVRLIHIGGDEEPDDDNPFIAAAKRGVAKIDVPRNDEGTTVREVIDYNADIDQ